MLEGWPQAGAGSSRVGWGTEGLVVKGPGCSSGHAGPLGGPCGRRCSPGPPRAVTWPPPLQRICTMPPTCGLGPCLARGGPWSGPG